MWPSCLCALGTQTMVRENRGERIIFPPNRTDNRNRSSSLKGSSLEKKWVREVGKMKVYVRNKLWLY